MLPVENTFPQRLTAIDDQTRGDHWYLRRTDVCRYLGGYAAGKGRGYSATNRMILDFKMTGVAGRDGGTFAAKGGRRLPMRPRRCGG